MCTAVADTEGGGQGAVAPLEARVPILPLQKSVESKAGNAILKYPVLSFLKVFIKKLK